jgi:hypothetical protein
MKKLVFSTILFITIGCIFNISAQVISSSQGEDMSVHISVETSSTSILKEYTLFFQVNKSEIDSNYLENGHVIETMISDIKSTLETDGFTPDSLLIYASSSPEGSYSFNQALAQRRAMSTKELILSTFPQLQDANIKIESRTDDWSGILQTINGDSTIPYRDEMLKILTDSKISNKEAALRSIPHVYAFVRTNLLNKMRTATISIYLSGNVVESAASAVEVPAEGHAAGMEHADSLTTHTLKNAEPALLPKSETEEIIPVEEAMQVSEVEQARERAPFYLAAKNNMLYDLVLVPNVGVELYLGNNISLAGNWMYAWWSKYDVHWFWKTYGGDLGVRYWFGKAAAEKPLQGHHVGLYGQIITYDFELGQRGYLGDRWTYGAGVEYGYSFPIARRLNLDLNLGLGFLYGEFKEYLPIDGHYVWQSTKLRQWVGPTKGEISLVWLLGRGNENSKKRGKR